MKVDIRPTALVVRVYARDDARLLADPFDGVCSINVNDDQAFVYGYLGLAPDRRARAAISAHLQGLGVRRARWVRGSGRIVTADTR